MHGLVVGAISSLLGVLTVAVLVSAIAAGAANVAYENVPSNEGNITVEPSLRENELAAAADKTGKILLGAGITLLVGLLASVGGGALSARRYVRTRHRTQEVPVVPPPEEPPSNAPHVNVPEKL
jgi:hypothetical protein